MKKGTDNKSSDMPLQLPQLKTLNVIDVRQLLIDITDTQPKDIYEIFSVILKQKQYQYNIFE